MGGAKKADRPARGRSPPRGPETPSPRSNPRGGEVTPARDFEPGSAGRAAGGSCDADGFVPGRLCALPDDAPLVGDASARGAFVGWELFATLGACVGETVEVVGEQPGARAYVRAWASRKLPPGGVALDRRVRAQLARHHGAPLAPRAELRVRAVREPPPGAALLVLDVESRPRAELHDGAAAYARTWLCGEVLAVGSSFALPWQGTDLWLAVLRAEGESGAAVPAGGCVRVTSTTAVQLRAADAPAEQSAPARAPQQPAAGTPAAAHACTLGRLEADDLTPALDRLGGLPAEVRRALSDLRLSLHRPELFEALGVRPVRGCLISGPPGSGRTAVARALAADAAGGEARVLHASAPQLVAALGAAGLDGELHALFARACALAPCVVCIDELEMIAPPRAAAGASGGGGDEASARVVGALLTALDGVCASARVALVATSSGGEALEPALRRPGRLDLELELAPPSGRARLEVLCKMAPALPARVARALAARSHGYVPADLAAVLRELSWAPAAAAADDAGSDSAVAEAAAEAAAPGGEEAAPAEKLAPEQLRAIAAALARVPPSALRDAQLEIPEVGWDDIGGQDESIAALREAVEWPLRYASTFARLGVRAPRGVLLYGPPGCSKTLTAKAIASTSGLNFVAVKGPELFSKWVGESEKAVQLLFKKARAAAPAIIFFDEIDALAPARAGGGGGSAVGMRVLAQLLHEMDGVGGADASGERAHVVVLGATNRPDLIDGALLRPGRFDRLLYVGLPDEPARLAVLKVHTRRTPLAAEVSLQAVAARTDGYSGAELAALCREAAMCALTETLEAPDVGARHFDAALATVSPRTPRSLLDLYARYQSRASGT